MSGGSNSDEAARAFDVSIESESAAPVIEVEEEDDDEKRKRDAALAPTFDQERAHDGKSDEEMIAEREQSTREAVDLAIAIGVVIAVAEASEADDEEAVDQTDDGGE
ncbi:MAG: hypothetical protein K2P70_17520 [Hyphomonadaceae bacterium]|nr:hypothetical protein [Hyphomonadaceae bacterium]